MYVYRRYAMEEISRNYVLSFAGQKTTIYTKGAKVANYARLAEVSWLLRGNQLGLSVGVGVDFSSSS